MISRFDFDFGLIANNDHFSIEIHLQLGNKVTAVFNVNAYIKALYSRLEYEVAGM